MARAEIVSVSASLHNHFGQERHLVSRDIYQALRSAALVEGRSLMAQVEEG